MLIPVMGFVFLMSAYGISQVNLGRHGLGLIFTDLSDNDHFFDINMPQVFNHIDAVFSLRSEESIRNGEHIEWVRSNPWHPSWHDGSEEFFIYELQGVMNWHLGSMEVPASLLHEFHEGPHATRIEASAIESQLSRFRYSIGWLQDQGGLYYFVTNSEHTLSNLPHQSQNADFFRAQPVYIISEATRALQASTDTSRNLGNFRHAWLFTDELSVFFAFSQEAVDFQTAQLLGAQRQLGGHIAAMIGAVLLSLAALIILMIGAGRIYGDESGQVHFTALDRPWLDFSFVALILYLLAITHVSFGVGFIDTAIRHNNLLWITASLAVLSVFFTLPLTWWMLSFTKRCKVGKFWQHTLIYTLVKWLYDFARSLWAGYSLTARGLLIGGITFLAGMFLIAVSRQSFGGAVLLGLGFAGFAVFELLRCARKLYLVEQGAKAASEGDYDARIEVTGGELGSIATSINNISGGINSAVAERMKSERLKTELITNVSHDIRTPITSLVTYSDLLKTEGLGSERAPEYLDILIQKTARLKTLTDDLFEASKAASGNIKVELETLDLVDFIRQVLGEMDERISASGLDFRLNLPEHAPVLADGKLLWRVMENLCSNVFKYALAGSRVYVDVALDGQWYRLDIKNISEHPLNVEPSELTERFKRGDSARAGEGSGLGLSIAQSFVQSQGGVFELSIDGDLFKVSVHLRRS